jgi:hypothetical protein
MNVSDGSKKIEDGPLSGTRCSKMEAPPVEHQVSVYIALGRLIGIIA